MENNNKKPTVFSGVQPSGVLHLGNYLGALAQWVEMQNQYNCIFCVVDYHAITVKQEPKELSEHILDVVRTYLAAGINPEKSAIFQQSDISAHTELAWILNCQAKLMDLFKMTQFVDKAFGKNSRVILKKKIGAQVIERSVLSKKDSDEYKIYHAGVGLFDYPVLMAADILLYNTDAVPVGDDQVQHVEFCRTLAQRFNREYGETFKIPEVVIRKQGARIMGLDDPTKKMSKSASSPANYIALTDAPEVAAKKIMRAVTDSGSEIKYDLKEKPTIVNLMTIYSLLAGISISELEAKYGNKGPAFAKASAGKYGEFKKDLAEAVKNFLTEFQTKYNSFKDDEVRQILRDGADKIRPMAEETLKKVKNKLGIG